MWRLLLENEVTVEESRLFLQTYSFHPTKDYGCWLQQTSRRPMLISALWEGKRSGLGSVLVELLRLLPETKE